ncbi:GLPGLI family protein [Chryseobacterium sp. H3056]|uniref:GLPGLI family protein n=1 Tax=Kaistella daneshvariae TaxID=2487074 RepID=A0A3N0WSA6_9FLAO|nr:GLPGLI family protein [Kaistella daneshvariae]ROI07795.1 GLPGLI family protein [Kaistella daneshvariae]
MKSFLFVFVLFLFGSFSAQNKIFLYELKFKPNPAKDSITTENFILDVKDGTSMFRTVKDRKSDSLYHVTRRPSFMTTSFKDFKSIYKNHATGEYRKYINNFTKLFSINVTENLRWQISNETKDIFDMKSQKATTNYGGRSWIAWFTSDIALQEGPYIFHGLPGLITEIYDTENNFHFTLTEIKNSEGQLYEKEKVLPISWKQYEKLALDYFSDPTREINPKNAGSAFTVSRWVDEKGNEITPNFKEMNEMEQLSIRNNNNPIELNHKINYK